MNNIKDIAMAAVNNRNQDFSECYELFVEEHDSKKFLLALPTTKENVFIDIFGTYYNTKETKNYDRKQLVISKNIRIIETQNYIENVNLNLTISKKVQKIVFLDSIINKNELIKIIKNFNPSEWSVVNGCYIRIH